MPKVAGRGDQASAQQVPPDPVHPDPRRERIVLAGDGPGQLVATAAIDERAASSPARTGRNRRGTSSPGSSGLPRLEDPGRGGLVGIVDDPRHGRREGSLVQFWTAF